MTTMLLIEIQGGVLQRTVSNAPIEICILDWDNVKDDPEPWTPEFGTPDLVVTTKLDFLYEACADGSKLLCEDSLLRGKIFKPDSGYADLLRAAYAYAMHTNMPLPVDLASCLYVFRKIMELGNSTDPSAENDFEWIAVTVLGEQHPDAAAAMAKSLTALFNELLEIAREALASEGIGL